MEKRGWLSPRVYSNLFESLLFNHLIVDYIEKRVKVGMNLNKTQEKNCFLKFCEINYECNVATDLRKRTEKPSLLNTDKQAQVFPRRQGCENNQMFPPQTGLNSNVVQLRNQLPVSVKGEVEADEVLLRLLVDRRTTPVNTHTHTHTPH